MNARSNQEERLGSWTRTLNEKDAVALLLAANNGQSIADWEAHGHAVLPQASRARRLDTLRIVRQSLLDRDPATSTILRSTWLRLFQEGSPGRRLNLLYGRLHAARPWILRAVTTLILPQLAIADEPLAPHDADLITVDAWSDFFARTMTENMPSEASKKTRWLVQRNLVSLGVLTLGDGGFNETRARHAEPDPLAFGWLLAHELRSTGRAEAPASWATTDSIASTLFATRRAYAEHCVETSVAAGLLTQGYLAGSPRLHPPPTEEVP